MSLPNSNTPTKWFLVTKKGAYENQYLEYVAPSPMDNYGAVILKTGTQGESTLSKLFREGEYKLVPEIGPDYPVTFHGTVDQRNPKVYTLQEIYLGFCMSSWYGFVVTGKKHTIPKGLAYYIESEIDGLSSFVQKNQNNPNYFCNGGPAFAWVVARIKEFSKQK